MDENIFLTRKEHEEFAKRMESENQRLSEEDKRQNHRIGFLEETFRQINDLTVSVKEMGVIMKNMLEEQKKQGERLEKLEREPAGQWQGIKKKAMDTVVNVIVTALTVSIFLMAAKYIKY